MKQKTLTVSAEYLPLHKYLDERFANTVVLTFSEIEDLVGVKLPDAARREPEWWANAAADGTPSVQARTWLQASRTAKANLMAHIVVFERTL
jgi:hypothetical protein